MKGVANFFLSSSIAKALSRRHEHHEVSAYHEQVKAAVKIPLHRGEVNKNQPKT